MLVLESVPIYGHPDQIVENPPDVVLELFDWDLVVRLHTYTGCLKKMVIELWSALARSLYNLQKSFFHSRKDQAFSFRMSPFL